MNEVDFTSSPARYAKGKIAIRCKHVGPYKTGSMKLAEAVGGRWTNREGAYILSSKAARDMHILAYAGWHGFAGWFHGQKPTFNHPVYGEMSRREAVKIAERDLL